MIALPPIPLAFLASHFATYLPSVKGGWGPGGRPALDSGVALPHVRERKQLIRQRSKQGSLTGSARGPQRVAACVRDPPAGIGPGLTEIGLGPR